MDLKNSCGSIPCYQARKGLHTGSVKTDPHKVCHLNYKILQNTFQAVKNIKFEHNCIGFFQTRKLTIYKMKSVRKSYTFQSLLKNITLLPADSSADSFIKNNL